jgi:iron complex outermembrane receptor protein
MRSGISHSVTKSSDGISANGRVSRKVAGAIMASVCVAALTAGGVSGVVAAETEQVAAGLEEIVVTARKREERLQDIPDAITALTADTIESAGIDSVSGVADLVPNLSIVQTQQPGVDFLIIRGIGQARNQEPPVAMVIDGVQLTSSYALTQELFDVERIEVLKGPQGALYGRNAIGGAINIVTKKPGNEFEGKVIAGYGNGEYWEAKGVVSGPVIEDKLFFRAAASYEDFEGTIRNVTLDRDVNFYDSFSFRGRILATPNERLTIDLRASVEDLDSGAAYFAPALDANDFDTPVQGDYLGTAKRNLEEYALKVDYDFDGVTLTSITAFSKVDSFLDEEVDYFAAPILVVDQTLQTESWSEELRLTSTHEGRFRWMVGAYYLDTSRDLETNVFADFGNYIGFLTNQALGVTPVTAGLNPVGNFVPLSAAFAQDDDKAYAGFGQVNYDITTDLELTLALRYDRNEKHQLDAVSGLVNDANFDLWQPKASLAYTVNEDAMIYATAGRGFRSGGFNATDTLGRIYDAEKTTSFELGFKTSWMERLLTFNGAAFYTKYDDRQEFILIANEGAQALVNIPKSRVLGLEFELAAHPVEGLDLQASLGLMDSEVREFDGTQFGFAPTVEFIGNQLPFAYGWSYAFAAQYRLPVFADFDLVTRVDYSGKGDMAWHLDGFDTQKAVHLVNARISLENEQFRFTVWAENLFDEKYNAEFIANQWSGGLADFKYPGNPRRYGVRASYRF